MPYFGAGPAQLPPSVLQEAADAVRSYGPQQLSILELEHRGPAFAAILEEADTLVKSLCGLGDDYEVLWMQGGGRLQFCTIPMNFLPQDGRAGYIVSGHWAKSAMESAVYYGGTVPLASTEADGFRSYPALPDPVAAQGLDYVHLTTNNTIYGTQLKTDPAFSVPLIADMSSDILGISRDYTRYDLFYAVAQKNLGAAGATLVCVKKDLLKKEVRPLPPMLRYAAHVQAKGVLNTPPVFAIYTCLLTLRWIRDRGLEKICADNMQKAALLYAEIERNPAFECSIAPDSRSIMNAVFRGRDAQSESAFLQFAADRGIHGIAGHRSVGGFRASLYNAVTPEDVQALIAAMQAFQTS